jgi:gamma-glutamyl hercynylcysteine S-oxide synthase
MSTRGGRIALDEKEMILIPAGPFIMGSDEFGPETPQRIVTLAAFRIDKFPVTNQEYQRFVDATGHHPPPAWGGKQYPQDQGDYAVDYVTWYDAKAYAAWVRKRLPTEAEWEKAARGVDGRRWPWGDTFDESRALVWENASALGLNAVPVTKYPSGASPYGVFQMGGHIENWVEDDYEAYLGSSYRSGCYGHGFKVLRGGSWQFTMQYARCAYRRPAQPDSAGIKGFNGHGFRCVVSAEK